jgi:hypothetical protein
MRLGKMPSFSLEVAQSLMLDAVHLGGERRMPEIQKSVRTTPSFHGVQFTNIYA